MFDNAFGLIVGIQSYRHITPLGKSLNDAEDVYQVLTDPRACGYAKDNVRLLRDTQADRAGILAGLDWLAATAKADSTVFVFMACHGGRIPNGELAGEYILPIETDASSASQFAATTISGALFTEKLRQIHSKKLLVILDCCHSGGIGQARDACAFRFTRGLSDDFHKQLATGEGRVIFCAAKAQEFAYELPNDRNGLFTKHLLGGLRGGAAADSVIRVFDLYSYVETRVMKEQPEQHPLMKSESQNFPVALSPDSRNPVLPNRPNPTADPTASPTDPEDVFLGLINRLLPAQFDELLFRLKMPREIRPAPTLTHGERAMVVLEWALTEKGAGEFEKQLRRFFPKG